MKGPWPARYDGCCVSLCALHAHMPYWACISAVGNNNHNGKDESGTNGSTNTTEKET